MNKLVYKLGAAVASGAMALFAFAPGVFAADLEITNNGDGSTNTIRVTTNSTCNVTQSADTNVQALVGASASTGGNTANSNTGGTTAITTGDATATATMTVTGGDNTATDPCCCAQSTEPPTSEISGNGVGTTNKIKVSDTQNSTIRQRSRTRVRALVGAKAKTGKNTASSNTGTGTTIDTGVADASSDLSVTGGSNNLP